MSDAAEAYAQWRIDNPGTVGWAQVAFMAGWAACKAAFAKAGWDVAAMQEHAASPIFYGVDIGGSAVTVVLMRRNAVGIIEVIAEKSVDLPAEMTASYTLATGPGYCSLPGGCTCIDKPNPAVQRMHCKSWKVERI